MQSCRVLVVDDDAMTRDLLQYCLSSYGHEVAAARDGKSALAALHDFHPDLILLDMGMSRSNGWAFVESYHGMPGPHASIILVSAWNSLDEVAKEIGADGYLRKPFAIDELERIVERFAPSQRRLA